MAAATASPASPPSFVLPPLFCHAAIMAHSKRMVQYEFDAAGAVVSEWRSDSDTPPADEEALAVIEEQGHTVYEILETGGFLKLYRKPVGRLYWHLQALTGNRAPDWKIHFSIHPEDLGTAWDVMARIFLERRCCSGMKIETQGERWPAYQHGREITVYILRHSELFAAHAADVSSLFAITPTLEHPTRFWQELVAEAEAALAAARVRPRGLADGDLALGEYASLRNEAFVRHRPEWQLPSGWSGVDLGRGHESEQWIYPPNAAGHNSANHRSPLPVPTATHPALACFRWSWLLAAAAAGIALAAVLPRATPA
eukprot:m.225934 g.225934  ORF g.225934 m.225934 type:complete len:313 (+) comp16832_c0_seq1:55-993(+)